MPAARNTRKIRLPITIPKMHPSTPTAVCNVLRWCRPSIPPIAHHTKSRCWRASSCRQRALVVQRRSNQLLPEVWRELCTIHQCENVAHLCKAAPQANVCSCSVINHGCSGRSRDGWVQLSMRRCVSSSLPCGCRPAKYSRICSNIVAAHIHKPDVTGAQFEGDAFDSGRPFVPRQWCLCGCHRLDRGMRTCGQISPAFRGLPS